MSVYSMARERIAYLNKQCAEIASDIDAVDSINHGAAYRNLQIIGKMQMEKKQLELALEFCSVF